MNAPWMLGVRGEGLSSSCLYGGTTDLRGVLITGAGDGDATAAAPAAPGVAGATAAGVAGIDESSSTTMTDTTVGASPTRRRLTCSSRARSSSSLVDRSRLVSVFLCGINGGESGGGGASADAAAAAGRGTDGLGSGTRSRARGDGDGAEAATAAGVRGLAGRPSAVGVAGPPRAGLDGARVLSRPSRTLFAARYRSAFSALLPVSIIWL